MYNFRPLNEAPNPNSEDNITLIGIKVHNPNKTFE